MSLCEGLRLGKKIGEVSVADMKNKDPLVFSFSEFLKEVERCTKKDFSEVAMILGLPVKTEQPVIELYECDPDPDEGIWDSSQPGRSLDGMEPYRIQKLIKQAKKISGGECFENIYVEWFESVFLLIKKS